MSDYLTNPLGLCSDVGKIVHLHAAIVHFKAVDSVALCIVNSDITLKNLENG